MNDHSDDEEEGEREPQSLVEQHKASLKKKSKREMKEEQRKMAEEEETAREERLRKVSLERREREAIRSIGVLCGSVCASPVYSITALMIYH